MYLYILRSILVTGMICMSQHFGNWPETYTKNIDYTCHVYVRNPLVVHTLPVSGACWSCWRVLFFSFIWSCVINRAHIICILLSAFSWFVVWVAALGPWYRLWRFIPSALFGIVYYVLLYTTHALYLIIFSELICNMNSTTAGIQQDGQHQVPGTWCTGYQLSLGEKNG